MSAFDSDFITFERIGMSPSKKTRIFDVKSKADGSRLGEVRWHAGWRRYCFFPLVTVLFDAKCLRDVAKLLDVLMEDHKRLKTMSF